MKCQRVREETKAYIDGELGPVARWRVVSHLDACEACRMEERAMTDLTQNMKDTQEVPAPEGLREKVLGSLDPSPAAASRRSWVLARNPTALAGVFIAVIVLAGVILPTVMRARDGAALYSTGDSLDESMSSSKAYREGAQALEVPVQSSPAPPAATVPAAGFPQMIIKTAELILEVKSFQKASDEAVSICKGVGGYVTNSSTTASETVPSSGSMTLRVPVISFENAIGKLGHLGVLKEKNIGGQDVTGEVVDLESKIRNKRAAEIQYLEIMRRASRIADIVTVSNELSRVRGEIEEAEGRLKYLKSAAAMSTINLHLSENVKAKPLPASSIQRTILDAVASFTRTANGLAVAAIWLGVYSPFWVVPIGVVFYLRRRALIAQ